MMVSFSSVFVNRSAPQRSLTAPKGREKLRVRWRSIIDQAAFAVALSVAKYFSSGVA